MFTLFYLYIIRNDDNKDDQSINQFYVHALISFPCLLVIEFK